MGVKAVAVGKVPRGPTVALGGNLPGGEGKCLGATLPSIQGGATSILMWDLYPVMLTSACQHVRGDGDNMQILCKDDVRSKTLSEMTFSAAVNVA